MSEITQLSDMNAALIASKEDSQRMRHERLEVKARIGGMEKRLEEQVAFTDGFRAKKTAALRGLKMRVDTLQDLLLQLDHVAKQTSDVHQQGLSSMVERLQAHEEGDSLQVARNLTGALQRLSAVVERRRTFSKRGQAETEKIPAAKRAKEDALKELGDKIVELQVQRKMQDDEEVAIHAARKATYELAESLRVEHVSLTGRLQAAESSLEQSSREVANIVASAEATDHDWNETRARMRGQQDSVSVNTPALRQRLHDLLDNCSRQEKLNTLEAEEATLVEVGATLATAVAEMKRQNTHEDPKVVGMRVQLQEGLQRHQSLTDQLAVSAKMLAAHTINEPDFDNRKVEYEDITSKISAMRSVQAAIKAREAALAEETKLVTQDYTIGRTTTLDNIAALSEERCVLAEGRKKAAIGLVNIQVSLDGAKAELTSTKRKSEKMCSNMQQVIGLDDELKNRVTMPNSDHESTMDHCRKHTAGRQEDIEIMKRELEALDRDIEDTGAVAKAQQKTRTVQVKQEIFAAELAQRTVALTLQKEGVYSEVLKRIQDEIVSEDTKLRAACAHESHNWSRAGVEERLQLELSDLHAQKITSESEVRTAELRIHSMTSILKQTQEQDARPRKNHTFLKR